jgi:phosphatidylglycerophosphate synthase
MGGVVDSGEHRVEAESPASSPGRWKERLDDPLNRFYRYPVARLLVRGLLKTPVSANQVSLVQPFLAGAAGYLLTFPARRNVVIAALLFELRAILDCADGTLARARGEASASGHAVDAVADWLATALLYAGVFWHFRLYPPPVGAWSRYLSVGGVLLLALVQGALRSFAADYYKRKYTAVFEHAADGTVAELCARARAMGSAPSIFARIDYWILRAEHRAFEHERFDPARTAPRADHVRILRSREGTAMARVVAVVWSVSNGDAFLSLVTLAMLTGRLWESQVFFALAGLPWILLVVALNTRFAHEGAWGGRAARTSAPP